MSSTRLGRATFTPGVHGSATDGARAGHIVITYAPDDEAHVDAVQDLWILLRAAGLDARMASAPDGSPDEFTSAAAVVVVGSPVYREIAAAGEPSGEHEGLRQAACAIADLAAAGEKSPAAVLPVVLPGGTVRHLPAFLSAHSVPLFRLRTLSRRGVAALVAALHERCGTPDPTPRHELRLVVSVASGRVRCATTLSGTLLCERDEPLPFGRDEVWSLLDLPDAQTRLARLGQRLSGALFDADCLDQLTTLVTKAAEGTVVDVVIEADGAAHELPFELIQLTDQQSLATVDGVRLTRTVAGVAHLAVTPSPGPLKILVAVGAPEVTENPALDVEAEMQAIVGVVGGLGRAEVTILETAGPQEIAEALRRDAYHVLHLSAHGSPYGVELEDRDGNAIEVQAEDLVRALRRGGRALPLIVLSSCGGAADADAGLAVTLLRHGAERVIAMQTTVTDVYATGLITRVYRTLAEQNTSVAEALAEARSALFDDAQGVPAPQRPEYAVAALFAAGDGPLWDAAAVPEPLSNPTELPGGADARDLSLGELVGRRALLRNVSRVLRDEVPSGGRSPLVNGVMLTGAAGIGKSALAGRVVNRLRDDVDDPWTVLVHHGLWNPEQLIADAAAGTDQGDHGDQALALDAVTAALRTRRLLVVFDDFEQNLTAGGAGFADPGFARAFTALCEAAERGKVLVASRYPVPGEVALLRVEVPPLGDAELRRMVLRLPAMRELAAADRETVLQVAGGHPRLLEFVDALLRGGGRARLPEVGERLRRLARLEQITIARSAGAAPGAVEATRQAVALAARDMLLDDLLGLLSEVERETLLQAAVCRVALSPGDLAYAVQGREVSEQEQAETAGHVARLRDLTLVTGGEAVAVEPWLREALTPVQGASRLGRHERAAAMCRHIVADSRADFATLIEAVHHLAAAGRFDELAEFAESTLPSLGGQHTVAAFLADVTTALPDGHSAYPALLSRERDALEAIGASTAAAAKGEELVARAGQAAQAAPQDAAALLALSAALDGQARLLHRLGRIPRARTYYEQALAIDLALSEAAPDDVPYQRNLALSLDKVARLSLYSADTGAALKAAGQALQIRQRLADAQSGEPALQRDLSACLDTLAAVHQADGDIVAARDLVEQALQIRRQLVEGDPQNAVLLADLLDGVGDLADLLGFTGPDAEQARQLTAEAASVATGLVEADPSSVESRRRLLASHWRLGDMDLAAGDLSCAQEHFLSAQALAQQLADADPASIDGQRDLGIALRRMADYTFANGQPEEVRGHLERSLEVAQSLVNRLPRLGRLHHDLAESRLRLGDWLRDSGDPVAARTLYRQALASRRHQAVLDPDDASSLLGQAEVYERLAQLAHAAGHPGRARRHWQDALALAGQAHAAAPNEAVRERVALYQQQLDAVPMS
ncbi:CHAT domain-containing protein [Catellatospora sp. NPDC049133]|uniref:CHAT domain-containing protein n=1 Tax=Catellatospora sp. NPDC049133 TaxID=3155499 RepID=UPI003405375C